MKPNILNLAFVLTASALAPSSALGVTDAGSATIETAVKDSLKQFMAEPPSGLTARWHLTETDIKSRPCYYEATWLGDEKFSLRRLYTTNEFGNPGPPEKGRFFLRNQDTYFYKDMVGAYRFWVDKGDQPKDSSNDPYQTVEMNGKFFLGMFLKMGITGLPTGRLKWKGDSFEWIDAPGEVRMRGTLESASGIPRRLLLERSYQGGAPMVQEIHYSYGEAANELHLPTIISIREPGHPAKEAKRIELHTATVTPGAELFNVSQIVSDLSKKIFIFTNANIYAQQNGIRDLVRESSGRLRSQQDKMVMVSSIFVLVLIATFGMVFVLWRKENGEKATEQ